MENRTFATCHESQILRKLYFDMPHIAPPSGKFENLKNLPNRQHQMRNLQV